MSVLNVTRSLKAPETTRLAFIVLSAWLTVSTASAAILVSETDRAVTPQQVVEIQLEALRQNDVPGPDAGIARVWEFAHPANRAVTGPLERLARMIKSERYRVLINHRRHDIDQISSFEDRAVFLVRVAGSNCPVVGFIWEMSRVRSGETSGLWMTTGVTGGVPLGRDV